MEDEDLQTLTMTIDQVVRAGAKWFPVLTVLCFLPYLVIRGMPDGPAMTGVGDAALWLVKWSLIAAAVYAVSAVLHELLHAGAMVAAGVPITSIRWGGRLREGIIYIHTARPMSAKAYRIVLLTPAIIQGLLPAVAGTIAGPFWLVLYGYVMLLSAVGDLAVFQLIRHLPGHARLYDHPESVGCRVVMSSL